MVDLRWNPWVAKLDGGAVCEYCHRPYDAEKTMDEQHEPDCPWVKLHRGDQRTHESNWTNAQRHRQLLTE